SGRVPGSVSGGPASTEAHTKTDAKPQAHRMRDLQRLDSDQSRAYSKGDAGSTSCPRRAARGSELVGRDDFAAADGAEVAPGDGADRALGVAHAAVGVQGVDAAGMVAAGR